MKENFFRAASLSVCVYVGEAHCSSQEGKRLNGKLTIAVLTSIVHHFAVLRLYDIDLFESK